jgi:hypothetical protein
MSERQSRCCFLAYLDCRSTCSSLVVVSCFLSIQHLLEAPWALHCITAWRFCTPAAYVFTKAALVVVKMVIAFT